MRIGLASCICRNCQETRARRGESHDEALQIVENDGRVIAEAIVEARPIILSEEQMLAWLMSRCECLPDIELSVPATIWSEWSARSRENCPIHSG